MNYFTILDTLKEKVRSKYDFMKLGTVEKYPIVLFTPKTIDRKRKNVLVTAGFHGEEIAGPYGLIDFIKNDGIETLDVNFSFIPVVNPGGFVRNKRYDIWNEQSNGGFINGSPSREGKILINHLFKLAFLAKDGFLTLHENEIRDKFYFFMLSNKNENSLIEALKKNALRKFEILPDGDYYTEAEGHYTIKNGYGLNLRDDTFEDLLFTKFKVPVCICHETPMKDNTLADRINVTSKSIGIFCDYIGGNMNVKKIADSIINSAKASELKGFVTDIEKDTIGNDNFRKVIYTGKNSQLVLMTLKPGEEIGAEIHDDVDQFFRIESGDGKVVINGNESVVKDGFAVVVPQGAKHNVVNTGDKPLKLYTIYSPPHHKDKVVYKTKTLAEASSEHFDGKTTE